jgi:vancomycin resistance protein YoaR
MSEYKPYFTILSTKTAKATTIGLAFAGFSCIISGILLLVYFNAKSHLPLVTTIEGVPLGNVEVSEAKKILTEQFTTPPAHTVTLRVDDILVATSSTNLGANYETAEAVNTLVKIPETTQLHWRVYTVLRRYFTPQHISLRISYRPEKLETFISNLQDKVAVPPIEPALILKTSGATASLTVDTGEIGRAVDVDKTKEKLLENIQSGVFELSAPVASVGAVLTADQVDPSLERGKKFVGKTVKFTKEGVPLTLSDKQLVSLLALPTGINQKQTTILFETWEKQVNRPPQEPVFEYDAATSTVKKFIPPKNGLTLNRAENLKELTAILNEITTNTDDKKLEFEKKLILAELPPKKSLSQTNDIGVAERIGFGESYYAHSIPNRVHNVGLAASRISLDIIKPGEEYSFNKHLGEVSGATGFKSAYVIQGNRTVLGDGGGVCQVSTTLFRSVLNAGLPVTRRLPHSYRVSYYELDRKPGIDATVYSGETDFRFKNDTGHHILVYGEADSKNLYMFFELYGTSDGRTAEIVDHKTWNFQAAPPPVYIPDPSLPPGKTVQVDWAAAGIQASFKNIVKDKNGKVIREEEYKSNYRPWSAKYLKGI